MSIRRAVLENRIGRFKIDGIMIKEHPEDVAEALKDVLIVYANTRFDWRGIEYEGYCMAFEPQKYGYFAPEYFAQFTRDFDESEEEFVTKFVEWKPMDEFLKGIKQVDLRQK